MWYCVEMASVNWKKWWIFVLIVPYLSTVVIHNKVLLISSHFIPTLHADSVETLCEISIPVVRGVPWVTTKFIHTSWWCCYRTLQLIYSIRKRCMLNNESSETRTKIFSFHLISFVCMYVTLLQPVKHFCSSSWSVQNV